MGARNPANDIIQSPQVYSVQYICKIQGPMGHPNQTEWLGGYCTGDECTQAVICAVDRNSACVDATFDSGILVTLYVYGPGEE